MLDFQKHFVQQLLLGIVATFLTACGGGGSQNSTAGDANSNKATFNIVIASNVKEINDKSEMLIIKSSDGTVSASNSLALKTGDVLIYNGLGMKIGSIIESNPASMIVKFNIEKPRIDELYSRLEIDGSLTDLNTQVSPSDARSEMLSWSLKDFNCTIKNTVLGDFFGKQCTFKFKDDSYTLPAINGQFSAGFKASFKKYDFIANTGSGIVSLAVGGAASLSLSKSTGVGTLSPAGTREACSSSLAQNGYESNGRILLAAPSFPLGVTGAQLVFPICISAGASASIAGEILSISPNARYDVIFESGKPPRATTPPSVGDLGSPSANTVWDLNPVGTGVAKLNLSGKGELATEVAMEISVVKLAYLGFMSRLVGQAELSAQFAPSMISATTSLATIKSSPQACVDLTLAGKIDITTFGSIPAFSLIGVDVLGNRILGSFLIAGQSIKYGLCGKSTSSIIMTSNANPASLGAPVLISVQVIANSTSDELAYDTPPSGAVNIFDQSSGNVFCSLTLDDRGGGSCAGSSTNTGSLSLVASYAGDSKYKPNVSSIYLQNFNGQFSFEVSESSFPLVSRLNCKHYDNITYQIDGVKASFDLCYSDIDAVIRCVGAGCTPGRFIVAIKRSTLSFVANDACPENSSTQPNLGIDPVMTSKYTPNSPYWFPLTTNSWRKAWPSVSSISPLLNQGSITRNVVLLTPVPPPGKICYLAAARLDLDFNVYDTSNGTYSVIPFSIAVP